MHPFHRSLELAAAHAALPPIHTKLLSIFKNSRTLTPGGAQLTLPLNFSPVVLSTLCALSCFTPRVYHSRFFSTHGVRLHTHTHTCATRVWFRQDVLFRKAARDRTGAREALIITRATRRRRRSGDDVRGTWHNFTLARLFSFRCRMYRRNNDNDERRRVSERAAASRLSRSFAHQY